MKKTMTSNMANQIRIGDQVAQELIRPRNWMRITQ